MFWTLSVDVDGPRTAVQLEDLSTVSSVPDTNVVRAVPTEEFVQLFSRTQRRLFLHILAQVSNPADAEEILQDTNVVIWSKFEQFQAGTNFIAWSFQIANYEVLKFRDKRRSSRLFFTDELSEVVAREAESMHDELDIRRAALHECLQKLRPKDRELIESRYAPGNKGKGVAEEIGRPINSVYQSFGRIRKALFECVNRRIKPSLK